MADSKKVTELPDVGTFTASDMMLVSHKVNSSTWASRSASLTALGLAVANALNYEALQTEEKTVIGAINELDANKPSVLCFTKEVTFTNGLGSVDVNISSYVTDDLKAYPVIVTGASEYFIVAESSREHNHYRFPIRTTRNATYSGTQTLHIFILVGNLIEL